MRKWLSLLAIVALLTSSFIFPGFWDTTQAAPGITGDPDPVDIGPRIRGELAQETPVDPPKIPQSERLVPAAEGYEPQPGTELEFLALDNYEGEYYFKPFTLRAVGERAEIWVANDRDFPQEDRNDTIVITDEQVDYVLAEFEDNIYGKVTEFFGMPESRNGENSDILGEGYYVSADKSDRLIILIDNVRDENFYDPEFPNYVAGFYSPAFQMYLDRNIITIDTYDWANRVGPDAARPHLYEGTVAHEFQHLIHDDNDPNEETWINEGMSDFAEFLVGYGHPEGHVDFFRDHPINSLVAWEDRGPRQILADYGIAYLFQLYLNDHYGGGDFIQALATNTKQGMASVNDTLQVFGYEETFQDVYRDFQTALVMDSKSEEYEKYGFKSIDFTVNIDSETDDTRSAPPWGSDFVPLEREDIQRLFFDGIDFKPTEWEVVADPEDEDNHVFWGGVGSLRDKFMIKALDLRDVVGAELTFDTWYDIEESWDYGFVQVSTDGGDTWTSLANEYTRDDLDPNAHPKVVANVPGLTGSSEGWMEQTFDLSAYDGEEILIAFRYVTDWASEETGWFVDNVRIEAIGYENDGSHLDDFQSLNEVQGRYVDYLVTFVQLEGEEKPDVFHVDPFHMTDDEEKELEAFTRMQPGNELVMTVTYGAPQGDLSYVDYDYDVRYQAASAAEMKSLVTRFSAEGEFADDRAAHDLEMHLTAVDRFERQGISDKVVKHMEGLHVLLDHQAEKALISKAAYAVLKASAADVIAKWE